AEEEVSPSHRCVANGVRRPRSPFSFHHQPESVMRTLARMSVLLVVSVVGCDVGESARKSPAVAVPTGDDDRKPADSSPKEGDREKIENPQYKSWAGFKPGTTVVHRTVTKATGADGETVTTSTYKLIELTPDKAVVEVQNSTRRYDGHEANNP